MALTKKEFTERVTAIGSCTDDAERRTLLADLIEEGGAIYDDYTTAETARAAAVEDNEKLREANMKLFLKVGDPGKPAEEKPKEDKEPPKLNYGDLFNEKGELK